MRVADPYARAAETLSEASSVALACHELFKEITKIRRRRIRQDVGVTSDGEKPARFNL